MRVFSSAMLQNFKLAIEYDGSAYCGWQRQRAQPTVQGAIEGALAMMTRAEVHLVGAGRTDAGVHALGQAANFWLDTRLTPDVIRKGLNSLLPPDIVVTRCDPVPALFHARFDAKSKLYRYCILNQDVRRAIGRGYSWFVHRPLNLDRMQAAAGYLTGRHDFKSFENSGSPRAHTMREVRTARWSEGEGGLLIFEIEADGFLRGMVRNIVGTLVAAGLGRLDPGAVPAIMAARDRRRAVTAAPARGLFLVSVSYEG
jgi:tRNA pseudouridine38-40 synthase